MIACFVDLVEVRGRPESYASGGIEDHAAVRLRSPVVVEDFLDARVIAEHRSRASGRAECARCAVFGGDCDARLDLIDRSANRLSDLRLTDVEKAWSHVRSVLLLIGPREWEVAVVADRQRLVADGL